tara:strand:- start:58 stop:264 length:207 start_codon:yes stop_codon:yes gene_type:complete
MSNPDICTKCRHVSTTANGYKCRANVRDITTKSLVTGIELATTTQAEDCHVKRTIILANAPRCPDYRA